MLILRNPTLVAFEAIARIGTVHGAAKELRLTQTAVTLRLKQLEFQLSMNLFLRSRRGMSLTPEGKALLQLCKGQRELEGQFLSQVSGNARQQVSLTIAGPTSMICTRVTDQTLPLYAKFPFLNLHLRADDHADLIDFVRRGECDLAVVPPNQVPDEMESKLLKPDRYLLVASKKWKGKKLQLILRDERVIDFYESDQTTARYLKHFGFEQKKSARLFANTNETLIRQIKAGIGFGTLTETVAKPYLESGALIALNSGEAMEEALALAWYPRPEKQDYFESILGSIH